MLLECMVGFPMRAMLKGGGPHVGGAFTEWGCVLLVDGRVVNRVRVWGVGGLSSGGFLDWRESRLLLVGRGGIWALLQSRVGTARAGPDVLGAWQPAGGGEEVAEGIRFDTLVRAGEGFEGGVDSQVERSCLRAQILPAPGPDGGRSVGYEDTGVGPDGGGPEIRHSRRLAAKDASSIADKAIARRASREDIGRTEGKRSLLQKRKKVQARSAKCGVLLTEGETNSFLEFVAHKA